MTTTDTAALSEARGPAGNQPEFRSRGSWARECADRVGSRRSSSGP